MLIRRRRNVQCRHLTVHVRSCNFLGNSFSVLSVLNLRLSTLDSIFPVLPRLGDMPYCDFFVEIGYEGVDHCANHHNPAEMDGQIDDVECLFRPRIWNNDDIIRVNRQNNQRDREARVEVQRLPERLRTGECDRCHKVLN